MPDQIKAERHASWIAPDLVRFGEVVIGDHVVIEPMCIIGKPSYEAERAFHKDICSDIVSSYFEISTSITRIGSRVYIGSGAIILEGAVIGNNSELEDRVRVGSGTVIGNGTRLMYEALVYNRVKIGSHCNVSGFLCNDTIVEDSVSFFGKTVHRYEKYVSPKSEQNSAILKAPHIKRGSIIAMDAILIGGITIGESSYVTAGAIISVDVPDKHVASSNNNITPIK